jgi:hypothetical protein
MAGLKGKTDKVGQDILDYLTAVAKHYDLTIIVTSGFRDPAGQGQAMFDNWIKLERGGVYHKKALPEADRKTLDGFYKTAKEDQKADETAKKEAEAKFIKLAGDKVGSKSRHSRGRAVDVTTASVPRTAYAAITKRMIEVKEGKRKDIYHFESAKVLAPVTEAEKKLWPKSPAKTAAAPAMPAVTAAPIIWAGGDDFPCRCIG